MRLFDMTPKCMARPLSRIDPTNGSGAVRVGQLSCAALFFATLFFGTAMGQLPVLTLDSRILINSGAKYFLILITSFHI